MALAAQKSKILVIGGTGYLGKYIVAASVKAGHPTFALVREATITSNPAKSALVDQFKRDGVKLIYGDINDHENLVKAIKQVDVIISAVGRLLIADQVKIIAAIKEAGNVKRLFPSEFGPDMDHAHAMEPAGSFFAGKRKIRRAVEAEGIPYTYIASNEVAGYYLANFGQENATTPPRDKVFILGHGNTKVVFVEEHDVATYTIKAVDDPRTLNKVLHVRPPANILSLNELVALWEKKIGKTLEKIFVPEDQIIKSIQESTYPKNLYVSFAHSVFVTGHGADLNDPAGVEASELYPEVEYTSASEFLDRFV
ncbi:Eugenol synthase 2 [Ancistrocladus abbreviatus]